jgi:hypothetical protein
MSRQLDALLSLLSELEATSDISDSIDVEPLIYDECIYISIIDTRQVVKFKMMKNNQSTYFIYDGLFGTFRMISDVIIRADKLLVPMIAASSVRIDESLVRFIRADTSIAKIAENEMSNQWILRGKDLYPTWKDDRCGCWIVEVFDTGSFSTI